VSCLAGLNGPTIGPDWAWLVLRADPGPLPVVLGHSHAGPNHAGQPIYHGPNFQDYPRLVIPEYKGETNMKRVLRCQPREINASNYSFLFGLSISTWSLFIGRSEAAIIMSVMPLTTTTS
jgi:hypothetical protein